MNFNMDLFEKTEGKEFGESEKLELGGHEVVIVDAREYTSEASGNTSLRISVDIAKGDKQEGFFKKQYETNTLAERKWSNGAVRYLSLKDDNIAFLKGFITALENSNKNFKFNTKGTWEQLKNLHCAGMFELEEYQKQDTTIGTATKLTGFRSLDKLGEMNNPKVKMLSGKRVSVDDYFEKEQNALETAKDLFGETVTVDNDLPFEI